VLTVSETEGLESVPELAVIWVVPTATPVAKPAELIVAVAGLEEVQIAQLVISPVLLSL
jgi:hypothetical protein